MEYYATAHRGLWRILRDFGKCAHDLIFSVTNGKCKYVSKMLNMYVYVYMLKTQLRDWRTTTDTVTQVGLVEKKEHFRNLSSLRKQPRCPLTNEWITKMWYIHTMEYDSALNRKEIL